MSSAAVSSKPAYVKLKYRMAGAKDRTQLQEYRVECGWGTDRLERYWGDIDRPLAIFSIEADGREEDVGMGGWILEMQDDAEAASREHRSVQLSKSKLSH